MDLRRRKSANINFRDELATIVSREVDFGDVLVTLTRVDVSPDFMNIKVYISVLLEERMGFAMGLLRQEIREIGERLAGRMRIKYIPKITFSKDKGQENYNRVEEMINELAENEERGTRARLRGRGKQGNKLTING